MIFFMGLIFKSVSIENYKLKNYSGIIRKTIRFCKINPFPECTLFRIL